MRLFLLILGWLAAAATVAAAATPVHSTEVVAAVGPQVLSPRAFLPVISRVDTRDYRPYAPSSIWNTPIGPAPAYDAHSAQLVGDIGGGIVSDPNQYSFPVYFADASTPRYNIPCTKYRCTVVTPQGTSTTSVLAGVPVPPLAQPAAGTDAQMIIIDTTSGTEYDLWQAVASGGGWSVSNGSVYNVFWDGMPARYGSRGAGVPYYAGLIRPWEIIQGRIEHALAFGYPEPASRGCVFPASKTDGTSSLTYAIPEGARLQLDPAKTEADFDAWGLSATGRIIARAMQQYGMFLIDHSGVPKIYVEDLASNPYSSQQWTDPALNLTNMTVFNIPYTAFRVIALPSGYWTSDPSAPQHGECYK